jgi:hypothetical protein
MAQDWDIKSRGTDCCDCGKSFSDGEKYWATLKRGDEGYEREDRCDSCWTSAELSAYSSWQGVFRLPPPPEEEALRKETAESLLRKLMELEDEAQTNVIYILALMLERKKTFVEKDVQVDDAGRVTRIYSHRKTDETFLIPDPQLELDKLEGVQQQVVDMLGVGSSSQGAETPPADADADAEAGEGTDEDGPSGGASQAELGIS